MTILKEENVVLNKSFSNKEEAIREAGRLLVDGGYVKRKYIESMIEREETVSTYMGNFIAIPHGREDAKELINYTGISVVQVPEGVNFGKIGEDKLATIIIGIAGAGDGHLEVLSQIAVYCSEIENVTKLADAKSEKEIVQLLGGIEA
ncbi:PTS sugar transporter subunit IIA [Marinilactibacillus psychrotolerans]|uniref:Mannitol-specific phosphotransferase enzyme IIA component n=2 Tax=Marinilactibacillus psychrotolerans TaxID=191770 RepID=A0ABW8ULL0_9LACT|nr:PTS sugar transporter subunit IIA [Marinilactibacillus psychrotolerans]SJN16977.1 PTS system, mannitol-specific IIA component [Marinilactibacillus psychrotolerans 42ea]